MLKLTESLKVYKSIKDADLYPIIEVVATSMNYIGSDIGIGYDKDGYDNIILRPILDNYAKKSSVSVGLTGLACILPELDTQKLWDLQVYATVGYWRSGQHLYSNDSGISNLDALREYVQHYIKIIDKQRIFFEDLSKCLQSQEKYMVQDFKIKVKIVLEFLIAGYAYQFVQKCIDKICRVFDDQKYPEIKVLAGNNINQLFYELIADRCVNQECGELLFEDMSFVNITACIGESLTKDVFEALDKCLNF